MNKIVFTEGFKHKGFKFGWLKKKLYRLPITKNGREYSLKEIPQIDITYTVKGKPIEGFRIARDKKSLGQVRKMTKIVNFKVDKNECKECA